MYFRILEFIHALPWVPQYLLWPSFTGPVINLLFAVGMTPWHLTQQYTIDTLTTLMYGPKGAHSVFQAQCFGDRICFCLQVQGRISPYSVVQVYCLRLGLSNEPSWGEIYPPPEPITETHPVSKIFCLKERKVMDNVANNESSVLLGTVYRNGCLRFHVLERNT
jgi:hypothetical protein